MKLRFKYKYKFKSKKLQKEILDEIIWHSCKVYNTLNYEIIKKKEEEQYEMIIIYEKEKHLITKQLFDIKEMVFKQITDN